MELNPLYSPDVGANEELDIEKVNESHTGNQKSSYSPESKSKYRTRSYINGGLYILNPLFEDQKHLFKGRSPVWPYIGLVFKSSF